MMPRFESTILLALTCLLVGRPSVVAEDWPLVRGDAFGAGVANTALADELEVLWKYPAGKDAGFDATPVIADGVVYIGDSAGTFHAVRLADGNRVWTQEFFDSGFAAGAAIEKGLIYVGDVNGIVRCLAASDAKEKWNQKLEGEVNAGPTPHGDYVLFTCEAGTLTWLNKEDGKPHNTFRIEAPLRCTPTIVAGRVVLAGCDSRLHIIDVESGKEIDSVEIDAPTGSTAAMRGDRAYFGTEGGTFYAINIPAASDKKASIAWQYRDLQRNQPIRAAAAVSDRIVVFGSQSKAIYLLSPEKGEEKWKMPTRTRVESGPVIAGNRVVAATAAGKIYLLDAASNEVKWEYDAGGGFTGSPAVVDGRIILGNTDGTLYCFGSKLKQVGKNFEQEVTEKTEKKK
jgi:outer membrane protein assembly factor BamB